MAAPDAPALRLPVRVGAVAGPRPGLLPGRALGALEACGSTVCRNFAVASDVRVIVSLASIAGLPHMLIPVLGIDGRDPSTVP